MDYKGLTIEDDHAIAEAVQDQLVKIGCETTIANDGLRGVELASQHDYDFVLLDVNLPGLDGVEVFKRIRESKPEIPIIMLTSESDDASKVLFLELGADDYVTKPFNSAELKARLRNILKRATKGGGATDAAVERIELGGLCIDLARHSVRLNKKEVDLTAREFDLLVTLAKSPGRTYSREQLNDELYCYNHDGYARSINSHVMRIRSKIEENPEEPRFIITIRGVGYRFAAEDELIDS